MLKHVILLNPWVGKGCFIASAKEGVFMVRLPTPGNDKGTWGDILNAFLRVEHNSDGTLRSDGSLAAKVATTDARLSDSRTPLAHAASHGSTGSDPLTPTSIGAVSSSGGGKEATITLTSGSNPIINLADGNVQLLTLTAHATITLTGATNGVACSLSLYLQQDSTGNRAVTWPTTVKWPGGIAPALSNGAHKIDLVILETLDGGTIWFGALAGADYR